MSIEVKLPRLGRTMEQATITDYLVKPGDYVRRGQTLFEIETDKVTMEIDSPADGYVKQIITEAGQTIEPGQVVMILGEKDEQPQPIETAKSGQIKSDTNNKAQQQKPAEAAVLSDDKTEVLEAYRNGSRSSTQQQYKLGQVVPMTRLQKLTARRTLESKRNIPCFYLMVRADMTSIAGYRNGCNGSGKSRPAFNDFIIRATAMAMERFPLMSGRLEADSIKIPDSINIGLAVSSPAGLIVPVVKDAANKDVYEIARCTRYLIEKARRAELSLEELEGACITISNLGSFGIEMFVPIVVPGQCSIIGIGRVMDMAVPNTTGAVIRKMMNITLSVDHRIVNGAYAAQFLDYLRKLLEDVNNFIDTDKSVIDKNKLDTSERPI